MEGRQALQRALDRMQGNHQLREIEQEQMHLRV